MNTRRFALPYLFGLATLVAIPLVLASLLAFTQFSGIEDPRWIGLDNFERMLDDTAFHRAIVNSLILIALSVPLRLLGVAVLSLTLHGRRFGNGTARSLAFIPSVIPDTAYALLWLWLLNPLYGPITAAFEGVGLASPGLLTDPWATRVALAAMAALQVGEGFVIALAWRRGFPSSIYEASASDGASPWFTLARITLPLMAPALALLALRDVVVSLHSTFAPAAVLTDGGPRESTVTVPLYIYRTGFQYFRLGYAAALSLSMLVMTALVLWLQYRLARRMWAPRSARVTPARADRG